MTKHDPSFDPDSLTATQAWVARALGMSDEVFRKKRDNLYENGFPRRDALLFRWIKADVEAWIARRRQLSDSVEVSETHTGGINVEKL